MRGTKTHSVYPRTKPQNGNLLADDFQFTAPIVGPLPKERFLKLWRQADVMGSTFPDMRTNAFGVGSG